MRQLIEDKICELVRDGADLSALEFAPSTTVEELPGLTDEELLNVYDDLIGFNG